MSIYHDEVEIEDMEYDEETGIYMNIFRVLRAILKIWFCVFKSRITILVRVETGFKSLW